MTETKVKEILKRKGIDPSLGIKRLAPGKKNYNVKPIIEMERVDLPYRFVPGFLPSTSGLHFFNRFPPNTKYPVINLPGVNEIKLGDASNGLCGGFVYTSLDLFLVNPRKDPPLVFDPPAEGTAQFNYLTNRLLDSFGQNNGYDNALKIIAWTQTPDHERIINGPLGHGLAHRMVLEEWPNIKADIDSGRPSPLMLVMEPLCGVGDIVGIVVALQRSHQVLAYAYRLDNNNLTIYIYDCNQPNSDSENISLNISKPDHSIKISSRYTQLRGFFRSNYSSRNPQPYY